jgi:Ulp1 family protease
MTRSVAQILANPTSAERSSVGDLIDLINKRRARRSIARRADAQGHGPHLASHPETSEDELALDPIKRESSPGTQPRENADSHLSHHRPLIKRVVGDGEPLAEQLEELQISGGRQLRRREKAEARARLEREEAIAAEERRKAEERRRSEAAKAEAERRDRCWRGTPTAGLFPGLSAEWEEKVNRALNTSSVTAITPGTGTTLTRRDFGTLLPQAGTVDSSSGWLNDNIIMGYLEHVVKYGNEKSGVTRGQTPRYHAFVSQFYNKLAGEGPASVHRWCSRARIDGERLLQVEHVFIPVNPGSHWTLLVVSPTKQTIEYLDSLSYGTHARYLRLAREWVQFELGDKFVESEWHIHVTPSSQQANGSDCGVFAITNAKMIMLGWDPERAFKPDDAALQRRRILAELINGGFDGDFAPPMAPNGSLAALSSALGSPKRQRGG